ncbi:MAG: response regulator receiver protein [Hyphomicrobiales bacterium]|nr:response regulator receiver protein [Hyphomicrobiales bacterium]
MGQAREIAQAMVVGSREETRHIASTLIEESGFHVVEADSMEEAAQLLGRYGQKIAFVFADTSNSEEARGLATLVARKWPWIRLLVSMDQDSPHDFAMPASASCMHRPWLPLDLLIEAERAMH